MNRADRRAIEFGRAFSPNREWYQLEAEHRPFVGIDADIYWAYRERCHYLTENMESIDPCWIDSEIHPFRY